MMGRDFSSLLFGKRDCERIDCSFGARSMESCYLTASSQAQATGMRFGLSGRVAGLRFLGFRFRYPE